jgi:hypothetical protein
MKTVLAWLVVLAAGTAQGEVGRLAPAIEGVYDIVSKCASPCPDLRALDRLVLVDSGKAGIEVSFHSKKVEVPTYHLLANRLRDDGAHLEADGFVTMGKAIELVLDIDPATGDLTGEFRDGPRSANVALTGKRVFSSASLYQPPPVGSQLGLLDIQGKFSTSRVSDQEFVLRTTLSGTPPVVGTWFLNHGARIDFNDSEYLPEMGVLLLYNRWNMGTLKWTIALRRNAEGAVEGTVSALGNANGGHGYQLTIRAAQRSTR